MNKFENKVKDAFDNTPDVLNKIKQSDRFFVPQKEEKRSFLDIFRQKTFRYSFVSAFLLVILAVFLLNGDSSAQIYASTVTLDVNPQIEITLDENDRVISVIGLNDDGEEFLNQNIDYKRMTLDEVIEILVDRLEERGYIVSTEDNVMLIHVDGVNTEVTERVKLKMEEKMKNRMDQKGIKMEYIKSNDIELTPEQLQQARRLSEKHNINPGRVILIQQIIELDDTKRPRDLKEMTMRQLHNLHKQLQNEHRHEHSNN